MKIHLAPMEGVLDHHMRGLLTGLGGYSHCVTEFIRVIDRLLPTKLFYRYCPELRQCGRTAAGTPVIIQLLGGIPEAMAENAVRAAALGAPGIDINFGCPSRFVNRKAGGAVLLKEPHRLHDIICAVRAAVPAHIPVSAKIRLGYENCDLALENAQAVQAAGASYITVHARTKVDGYKHPARWEWLARINEILTIPMVNNGDINSVDDYHRCRTISGSNHVMIGRHALAQPGLAQQIKAQQLGQAIDTIPWHEILPMLLQLPNMLKPFDTSKGRYIAARLKQWLTYLRHHYSEAQQGFQEVRGFKDYETIVATLQQLSSVKMDR